MGMEAHNLRLAGRDGPDRRCGRSGSTRHGARVRLRARKESLRVPERACGQDVRRRRVEQRSMQDLFSLAGEIEVAGGESLALPADVLDPGQLQDARDALLERWGGVDILVNAAGGNVPGATLSEGVGFYELPEK